MAMKVSVVVFPGSNCDRDASYVTHHLLGQPTQMVWHESADLKDADLVIVPGGFSYGDYLRCGAIARFSPALKATVEHAQRGGLVLGICNGFQILTEAGLLPGALVRNRDLHFVCDQVTLKVERTDLAWTQYYTPTQVITLPIAHGEGCYYASPDILKTLEDNCQIVFRYSSPEGQAIAAYNPNGSLQNIAGICNQAGNVLGMMPHPERASDPLLGPTDGLTLLKGAVSALATV